MENPINQEDLYGLMAEFESPDDLVSAAEQAYQAGYRKIDAFSPFPIEGLSEAIGMRRTFLPFVILGGGITGALAGYMLQYYSSVIAYPMNVGGRPLNSWPSFIPITFEFAILFAAFAAVLGMFALNGLPQPYHPVFNAPSFELASRSHFFLNIESGDPLFDLEKTRQFLESLNPASIAEVEF